MSEPAEPLAHTPLHALHRAAAARLVGFAGYEMPLHFPTGILAEHLHTRAKAGLFDVSHMGQIRLHPRSGQVADAALALEALTPADIVGLAPGRQRYALFTNARGGILDDLMVANTGDALVLVVNAACKWADLGHLTIYLAATCDIEPMFDRALLALQGPAAQTALAALAPEASSMRFMDVRTLDIAGVACLVSRSGYTGEDGFEISIPAAEAEQVARLLLSQPDVLPIGLGARDSLRLEAGLCLYGTDLDTQTTPIEAALEWSIGKARKAGEHAKAAFLARMQSWRRVPVVLPADEWVFCQKDGAPLRGGTRLYASEDFTVRPVGTVTSGAFGPTLAAPVAMAMVNTGLATPGTSLIAELRGRAVPACVAPLPFVAPGFKRPSPRTAT